MNKSTVLLTLTALFTCLYVSSASGSTVRRAIRNSVNSASIESIIEEIKKSQGVGDVFEIDPDKVSDSLLERTGEALIKSMPPNPREHEIFDSMIVGQKGLSSLSAVHRVMGYHYLIGDFYGGPGNLSGPSLVCAPTVPQSVKDNYFIAFSARYLALLWFLIITLALTNIYLLLKMRRVVSAKKGVVL